MGFLCSVVFYSCSKNSVTRLHLKTITYVIYLTKFPLLEKKQMLTRSNELSGEFTELA